MEGWKLRGTVGDEAVENIPDFATRGETVNGTGLSVVSPTSPQTPTWRPSLRARPMCCAEHGKYRNGPGRVGEDFLIRRLRCRCSADLSSSVILAAHTPWVTVEAFQLHSLLSPGLAQPQVLRVCRIRSLFLPIPPSLPGPHLNTPSPLSLEQGKPCRIRHQMTWTSLINPCLSL